MAELTKQLHDYATKVLDRVAATTVTDLTQRARSATHPGRNSRPTLIAAIAGCLALIVGVAMWLVTRSNTDDHRVSTGSIQPTLPTRWSQLATVDTELGNVTAFDGGLLAFGYSGIWVSVDGREWEQALRLEAPGDPRTVEPPLVTDIAATSRGIVAVGRFPDPASGQAVAAAWTSRDGRDWARVEDPALAPRTPPIPSGTSPPFGGSIAAVTEGGPGYVAVGEVFGGEFSGSTLVHACCPAVWTSTSGVDWTGVPGDFSTEQGEAAGFSAAAHLDGSVLAFAPVGDETAVFRLSALHGGGTEWGPAGSVPGVVQSVTSHQGALFAVGSAATEDRDGQAVIWTSRNGSRWRRAFAAPPAGITSYTEVASNGRALVAIGYRGRLEVTKPGLITVSTDGEHWRALDLKRKFPGVTRFQGVTAIGPHFVATGRVTTGAGTTTDPFESRTAVFASTSVLPPPKMSVVAAAGELRVG